VIIEHALLHVRQGRAAEFEAAISQAKPLIAASPGFQGIELRPAAEESGLYLLIVRWDDIASHRDGFRMSDRYQEWREVLHHFYEPMPDVCYFGESLWN
jgi:heme-degrading monooxygenase HmoA